MFLRIIGITSLIIFVNVRSYLLEVAIKQVSHNYYKQFIIVYKYFAKSNKMTTAHRPTWKAAYGLADSVGKGYVPTRSYSARDLPGYLELKERQWGQGSVDELKQKDFKAELQKRENAAKRKKNGDLQIIQEQQNGKRSIQESDIDFIQQYQPAVRKKIKKPEQQQIDDDQQNQSNQLQVNPFPQDEDSEEFVREEIVQKKKKRIQSDEDDEDNEDDSEQLLRQYQKIKEQRQKQQLFRKQQKHKQSMMNREAELLKGNPLIDSSYSISKRWYQDTVFRNQAKKVEETKNFVNDYVRSDFHRKFMNRYVCR